MTIHIDASRVQEIIRDNSIPPRPFVLEAVHEALRHDNADLRRLEKTLVSDVGISAGLIKMANSPYFGIQRRVRSVMEAIEVIGLAGAARAVACISLKSAFPHMNLERFWDSSAKVAQVAGWLVRELRVKGVRSEDAYTFGMFRDCGIAIMLQRFPGYVDVLRMANQEAVRSFAEVEEDTLPVGHAPVGAMMTQTWWLPDDLIDAVRYHHDPDQIDPAMDLSPNGTSAPILIALAQLAEYLVQNVTGQCSTQEWPKLGSACLIRLRICVADIPDLQVGVSELFAAS